MKTNTKWTEEGGRLPGMKERGCCLQRLVVVAAAAAGNPGDSSSKRGGCAVRSCCAGRWRQGERATLPQGMALGQGRVAGAWLCAATPGHGFPSFDHPSDTFLPGMKVGNNRKTGQRRQLTSWIDAEDPQPGLFSFGLDTTGPLQFFIWKDHVPYSRTNVYSNSMSLTKLSRWLPFAYYITVKLEGDDIFLSYSISDISAIVRITLVPNGRLEALIWEEKNSKWFSMWQWPKLYCDFYGHCSPFSSCDKKGSPVYCKCLTGFQPKVQQEWHMTNWTSDTCVRQKALTCDKGDGFLKIETIKLPDHSYLVENMSANDCESRCLQNCSCTAYALVNASQGNSVNCLSWYGDLMDIVHDIEGQILYVRVHDRELVENDGSSDNFSSRRKCSITILVAVISLGVLTVLSGYFTWRKRFGKQGIIEESFTGTSTTIGGEAGNGDTELNIFSLNRIQAATNDFSEDNKLGEGGFGTVYKGDLAIQEVAIKRLSKKSGQGLEEFMNESKLISKLQHTNLVRLLGCCAEGEERILVYEYMRNRSLDKFLFDPSEKANLNWSKRFPIIEGIAQGLLYLHKYSRLKVIHRDLKASNILLDDAMNPKISDFGLARMFGSDQTEADTKRVVGTYGYMSPEYAQYGKFSEKSDIFSFGVLLLEIVTGKRNADFFLDDLPLTLQGWAWELWNEARGLDLIDPSIKDPCESPDRIFRCIHVGLLCVQESPADRPPMPLVVQMLSNDNASLPSPKEPAFSSLSRRRSSNFVAFHNTSTIYSNNELTISLPEAR
ncbi:receptor-like serine/threonine-protein kinase SD1-8 [Populus alba x Populus x berolinensis]|uniref:Receptor-like serine/threonine-protein kinase n=1 Tax=Populus alba x Populus x berolinensis TaxID=444605 RepID=A0AAD6PPP3_9ROSI|nr:receptor-like serine/threonine-protein kinase SD1-8 [Populus alba x Populus x berolinensis]